MKPKAGMKSRKQDGGACWRQWYRTRKANLLRLSGEPPANFCIDQLNVTVCCRYAETLIANSRINRYLAKPSKGIEAAGDPVGRIREDLSCAVLTS